jgi:hypothetical protein
LDAPWKRKSSLVQHIGPVYLFGSLAVCCIVYIGVAFWFRCLMARLQGLAVFILLVMIEE